jgi:hypothetical protein
MRSLSETHTQVSLRRFPPVMAKCVWRYLASCRSKLYTVSQASSSGLDPSLSTTSSHCAFPIWCM